ncbi:MAG: hypothetical protein ACLUEV_11625 [Alistipes sp.]
MKNSIDFLPERKQRDLHELVRLIRDEVKDVVMVILYGSYARNTYVECDERRDFGVRTFYISDYDLLVVTKKRLGVRSPPRPPVSATAFWKARMRSFTRIRNSSTKVFPN